MSTNTSDNSLQINQLPQSLEMPKDFDQYREITSLLFKRIIDAVNKKEGSLYYLQEIGNFQSYYSATPYVYRNVYRNVFDMVSLNAGPITAGTTVSVAHGIVGITQTTRIYGSATNSDSPIKFLPLPYVSATTLNTQVQIYLDPTNVTLINGAGQSTLSSATIVAEYLKN